MTELSDASNLAYNGVVKKLSWADLLNVAWIVVLLGWLVTGCDSGPECIAPNVQPGTDACSPVQVDFNVDTATAVHDRLSAAVRERDGIGVNYGTRDLPVVANGITIVSKSGDQDGLFVLSHDNWLPQEVADGITADAVKREPDRMKRVLLVIKGIHDWQDSHPRPAAQSAAATTTAVATTTVIATPSTVTVTARPLKLAGPEAPYNWAPIIWIWGIMVGYVMMMLITGRVLFLHWQKKCPECEGEGFANICTLHGPAVTMFALFWLPVLPVWFLWSLCMRIGSGIGDRDHTPRQQRKLLAQQNAKRVLEVEAIKAQTAYNESAAVLKSAGLHLPEFEDLG